MKKEMEQSVWEVFFSPVREALAEAENKRKCVVFSDWQFLWAGVERCLQQVRSGREYIQKLWQLHSLKIAVSCFFEALGSQRRLRLLQEINEAVVARVDASVGPADDAFAEHPELENFAVFAADTHFQEPSVHEGRIKGKRPRVGHLFAINLRTLSAHHLAVAGIGPGGGSEHDVAILKRLPGKTLRMGTAVGKKVIYSYDRAGADIPMWESRKRGHDVYFVIRLKKNLALIRCGCLPFDRSDPRNNGVVSDEQVGVGGILLRLITYIDPVSGTKFEFLTNEMTLPPGIIAFIHKRRWDVEKLFDEFKTKLSEKKAWARKPTAKAIQAAFLCLTHNLMLLLERKLEAQYGIVDQKVLDARRARIEKQIQRARAAGRSLSPMLTKVYRSVQRSFQFIRWLINAINARTLWRYALQQLPAFMMKYIS